VFALKYIDKFKCIKMKAVNNIIQERRLLEDIEFPLIVNLRYAFQVDSLYQQSRLIINVVYNHMNFRVH
jgi:hypothetical protein